MSVTFSKTKFDYVLWTQGETFLYAVQMAADIAKEVQQRVREGIFDPNADIIVAGLWRGGAYFSLIVHHFLIRWLTPFLLEHRRFPDGLSTKERRKLIKQQIISLPIVTMSYTDVDRQGKVHVLGGKDIMKRLRPGCLLILVDDVFDRGKTIEAVLNCFEEGLIKWHDKIGRFVGLLSALLRREWKKVGPRFKRIWSRQIRFEEVQTIIATIGSKPAKNETDFQPDIKNHVYSGLKTWLGFIDEFEERDEDDCLIMTPQRILEVYTQGHTESIDTVVELVRSMDEMFQVEYQLAA